MTTAIAKIDAARRALQLATKPFEVQGLRNQALGLEHYARVAKDRDLEVQAAELRMRAERRLGELLIEAPKNIGGRTGKVVTEGQLIETLEQLGISRNHSSLCQRLAKIPGERFESYLVECREVSNPARAVTLIRPGRDDKMAVHHSSASDEHYTPAHIVTLVQACFGGAIDLDPCCNPGKPNVQAAKHYRMAQNGLKQPWHGNVYCNPPYSDAGEWVDKAITEFQEGRTDATILLLAARPETNAFHALRDFPVCFIKGRLTFIGNPNPAPFPSALVWVSEQSTDIFAAAFEEIGTVFVRWAP